jgi:hypothetical protein
LAVLTFAQARLDAEIIRLTAAIAQVTNAPLAAQLQPIGLAEIWIGSDAQADIPKKDGVLYDSCLTCHHTLAEVLCTRH